MILDPTAARLLAVNDANVNAFEYGRMKGWTDAQILSACGHPGYGEEFAHHAIVGFLARRCLIADHEVIAQIKEGM